MRIAIAAAVLIIAPAALSAETHKYKPTAGVPTFAVRPPVLTIKPGDVVETETFSRPGDYYDPKVAGPWPGEVGPFAIEGAAPGDTLVVRILKLAPNRDIAISNVTGTGISGVASDSRTRMLNDPLPARRFVWRLDRARAVGILDLPNSAMKRIEIPLRPMLGRVAVAPAGEEAWGGLWPGDFGGNMDASDVTQGVTVYLRSSIPARSSISATFTRCRATVKSPARASSPPPTSRSSSICRKAGASAGRGWRTTSTSWWRAASGR
jgi:hypothetical protein